MAEFQFLTAKPVIVVVNAGEDQLDGSSEIEARLEAEVEESGVLWTVLPGKLEMELAQMEPEDEREFRGIAWRGRVGAGPDGAAVV